jgi:hypothetical protein
VDQYSHFHAGSILLRAQLVDQIPRAGKLKPRLFAQQVIEGNRGVQKETVGLQRFQYVRTTLDFLRINTAKDLAAGQHAFSWRHVNRLLRADLEQ